MSLLWKPLMSSLEQIYFTKSSETQAFSAFPCSIQGVCFYCWDQNGCLNSSHHTCIPERRKGQGRVYILTFNKPESVMHHFTHITLNNFKKARKCHLHSARSYIQLKLSNLISREKSKGHVEEDTYKCEPTTDWLKNHELTAVSYR